MDQKLKNYSSGMQVRLAFSVAIKAQGDILVLDEVLAVGDEAFQRKCDNFFAEIKKDPTKTVILVTHSMDAVKKYCNKAILIKDGEIIASGDKNDVADRYTLENLKQTDSPDTDKAEKQDNEAWLKVLAASKPVCSKDDVFEFDIEYFFDQDVDFYFTMTLIDKKRGGLTFDPGPPICISSIIQATTRYDSRCLSTSSTMVISRLWRHCVSMIPTIRRSLKPSPSRMEMTPASSRFAIPGMEITHCSTTMFFRSNAKA